MYKKIPYKYLLVLLEIVLIFTSEILLQSQDFNINDTVLVLLIFLYVSFSFIIKESKSCKQCIFSFVSVFILYMFVAIQLRYQVISYAIILIFLHVQVTMFVLKKLK